MERRPTRIGRLVRPYLEVLILSVSLGFVIASCGAKTDRPDGTESAEKETASTDSVGKSGEKDPGADSTKSSRERTTSVTASEAARGNLVIPIFAEGRIRARRSAEIRSEIGGRIDRVLVEEGSRVRKGASLLRLDGREYEVSIAEARSRATSRP
jgi:multidrug efflux pump subunit AcrA (membrane-fusion protein)